MARQRAVRLTSNAPSSLGDLLIRRALSWISATSAIGALIWSAACGRSDEGTIVVGVLSQLSAPQHLSAIRIEIRRGQSPPSCEIVPIERGSRIALTREVSGPGGEAIAVSVAALDASQAATGCAGGAPAAIVRNASTTIASQEKLFLPVVLRRACESVACPDGQSCAFGTCRPSAVPAASLVRYEDSLVSGQTSFCASYERCFEDRLPAVRTDRQSCHYRIPDDANIEGRLNVAAIYDDLSIEWLDTDRADGITIDADDRDAFTLAPDVCSLVQSGKIRTIFIGAGCRPRRPLEPLCAPADADAGLAPEAAFCTDATDLPPASASLYLLVDRSAPMNGHLGQGALAGALPRFLGSDAFRNTRVAMAWLPADGSACTGAPNPYGNPDGLGFGFVEASGAAARARDLLASTTGGLGGRVRLEVPLGDGGAFDALASEDATSRRAIKRVLVVGNHDFYAGCAPAGLLPRELALRASVDRRIQTSAIVLSSGPGTDWHDRDPLVDAVALARSGGAPFFDTTGDIQQLYQALAGTTVDLTTCLYEASEELTSAANPVSFHIDYFDPFHSRRVSIPFDPACRKDAPANGWNFDDGRVRLCGKACDDLRFSMAATTHYAIEHDLDPIDIPVRAVRPCP